MIEELDTRGLKCPLPILKAKKELANLSQDDELIVLATDKNSPNDFEAFCRQTGHQLLANETIGDNVFRIVIRHK